MSIIKKINQAVEIFFSNGMTEVGKARIIANIEKVNSPAYKMQVVNVMIANEIIDDMLNDPFWSLVIAEAKEAGTL